MNNWSTRVCKRADGLGNHVVISEHFGHYDIELKLSGNASEPQLVEYAQRLTDILNEHALFGRLPGQTGYNMPATPPCRCAESGQRQAVQTYNKVMEADNV